MTIKQLPGQEPESKKGSKTNVFDEKPVLGEYLRKVNTPNGTVFPVIKAKLTLNGWLLIETEAWVGFINGKSTVAKTLLTDIAPNLHNKEANSLVAVINNKNKFKFVLGLNDEETRWYYWDDVAFLLTISTELEDDSTIPNGDLKLEDFLNMKSSSQNDSGEEPPQDQNPNSRKKR